MKSREMGLYCSVAEAGRVLGISPAEIREQMKAGTLNIGTAEKRNERTAFRIRRDLLMKEAGLDEFPQDIITDPMIKRAERTGMMLKAEGLDAEAVAEILLKTGMITEYQRKKMAGVM